MDTHPSLQPPAPLDVARELLPVHRDLDRGDDRHSFAARRRRSFLDGVLAVDRGHVVGDPFDGLRDLLPRRLAVLAREVLQKRREHRG